jgi:hypothetical protein
MRKKATIFGLALFLALFLATLVYADGMMHVGHLMGPETATTSASGQGIITESNILITTESGDPLRTE